MEIDKEVFESEFYLDMWMKFLSAKVNGIITGKEFNKIAMRLSKHLGKKGLGLLQTGFYQYEIIKIS